MLTGRSFFSSDDIAAAVLKIEYVIALEHAVCADC